MKIETIQAFLVRPRWCFVKITTDAGLCGWGEAVLEGKAETVRAAVYEMADYLIGKDPARIEDIWNTLYRAAFYRGGGILMSAISGIDQQMYEAAMVDGANRMQKIWYITVPSLMPTFIVLLVLSLGAFLSTGMEIFMVFGNAMNLNKLEVLDLYLYNLGLGGGKISFGVAAGILTSIVSLVLFTVANNASKLVRGTTVF